MAEQRTSIRKNFLMNALLTMSAIVFPLISFPYVSRVLLPAGTGRVQFVTSVVAYFSMFAQLGIPTYGIRACAKARDDRTALTRTAHELLAINLIMNGIVYLALAGTVALVPRLREEKALFAVLSLTILLTSLGMEWLYKALEQYTYITVRSVAFKLVALGALFLLVRSEKDCVIYAGISIFASSASSLMNLIHARRCIGFRPVGGYDLRRHLKPVAVFFAMACATTIYTHLDSVMLGFMATDADVGYYSAAVKVKFILVSLITSLGAVLLPRSSWQVEHGDMAAFRRTTRRALRFVFLLAVPLAVYFMLYARETIRVLSGEAFAPAVAPMRVIMPTLVLIGATNILGIQILVPTGREQAVLRSEIAGAATDLILNALLIPRMQATGAAIGTLAAEAVVLAVQYHALRAEMRETFRAVPWGTIAGGTLLGTAACVWVKAAGLGSAAALVLSAALFFGVYGGFLLIRKEEMTTELTRQAAARLRRGRRSAGNP
jgi:Membrane protein involved in the export of O-antigen and teichoic acid